MSVSTVSSIQVINVQFQVDNDIGAITKKVVDVINDLKLNRIGIEVYLGEVNAQWNKMLPSNKRVTRILELKHIYHLELL